MRGKKAPKRKIKPDLKYDSTLVTRFVNNLMWDGKKTIAFKIFYGALDMIKEQTENDPLEIFHAAIQNVMPVVEVRSRRIGKKEHAEDTIKTA